MVSRDAAGAGLTGLLIGTALSRWPAELRTELAAAWTAEIFALDREDGVGAAIRAWRKFRFALSLAVARPVEPLGEPPRGWRQHLVSTHRTVGAALLLLTVPVAAMLVAVMVFLLPTMVMSVESAAWRDAALAEQALRSLAAIAAAVGAGLLGLRLARRVPLVPVGTWPLRPVVCAVGSTALLLTGAIAVSRWLARDTGGFDGSRFWAFHVVGTAVALAPIALVAILAARYLAQGRIRWVLAVTVLGAFVVVDLGVAIAGLPTVRALEFPIGVLPLWLPMDLFAISGEAVRAADESGITALSPVVPGAALSMLPKTLFITAAFGIGYLARLQRLPIGTGSEPLPWAVRWPAAPDGATRDAEPAPARGAWSARTAGGVAAALATAVVGILVWAVTTTGVLAGPAGGPSYYGDQANDLRYAAITLTALAIAATAVRLGAVLTPVLMVTVGLVCIDTYVAVGGQRGARYAVAAAVLAIAIGCFALRLSPMLISQARTEAQRRRLLTGIAVVAAFSAPAVPGHGEAGYLGPTPPPEVWFGGLAVSATLVLLAAGCAVAARPVRPSRGRLATLMATAGAVAAAVAIGSTDGLAFVFGPPVAVAALAVARFPGRRPVRSAAYRLTMVVLAALVAPVVWFVTGMLGRAIGLPLAVATGSLEASEVFAAPVVGLLFAAIVNRHGRAEAAPATVPSPSPAPSPAPLVGGHRAATGPLEPG